jgi:hypothetical protein
MTMRRGSLKVHSSCLDLSHVAYNGVQLIQIAGILGGGVGRQVHLTGVALLQDAARSKWLHVQVGGVANHRVKLVGHSLHHLKPPQVKTRMRRAQKHKLCSDLLLTSMSIGFDMEQTRCESYDHKQDCVVF